MREDLYKEVFKPIQIKGMTFKNRIVMTPVQVNFSTDRGSNQRYKDFFGLRAAGGASLIMVEAVMINKIAQTRCLCLHDDALIPPLAELAETIHLHGALAGIQINHLGRQGDLIKSKDAPPLVAPSPIPWSPKASVPRELTRDDISELVYEYAEAARRVKDAGFDMVEIHGAHGYLISQFFSPLSNIRKDEYGRDIPGRARFAIEVIRKVREIVGDDFPVSIRINGSDNVSGGLSLDDVKKTAPLLVGAGVDMISISAGVNGSYPTIVPCYDTAPACYVPLAEGVKDVVDIPVLAGGCINDLDTAEEILRMGKVDMVAMSRAFIADPEIIRKTVEGKKHEIRKCIHCNTCIETSMFGSITCLANPEAGHETDLYSSNSAMKKNVMVIGAGLAGMETAMIAASRGHKVAVYEKEKEPGGQWRLAAAPPHKQNFMDLVRFLSDRLEKFGVELNFGKEMNYSDIKSLNPDVVVVATGAMPLMPPVPGIEQPNVIAAHDVLKGHEIIGEKVLVIGGGGIGLETAELLAANGKEITVIEMLDRAGKDLGVTVRYGIMSRLKESGMVRIYTGAKVDKIECDRIHLLKGGSKELLEGFDTIVVATGMRSNNKIAEEIRGIVSEIYVIGDAVSPRRGSDAMREGFETGLRI